MLTEKGSARVAERWWEKKNKRPRRRRQQRHVRREAESRTNTPSRTSRWEYGEPGSGILTWPCSSSNVEPQRALVGARFLRYQSRQGGRACRNQSTVLSPCRPCPRRGYEALARAPLRGRPAARAPGGSSRCRRARRRRRRLSTRAFWTAGGESAWTGRAPAPPG
jgi:hypothetical protein